MKSFEKFFSSHPTNSQKLLKKNGRNKFARDKKSLRIGACNELHSGVFNQDSSGRNVYGCP
jgi:hypothetical protein